MLLREIDGDELDARLDQPAGEQARLAIGRAAVAVADFGRLGGEVERLAHLVAGEHADRPVVVLVEAAGLGRVFEQAGLPIDELLHFAAAMQPVERQVVGQAQLRQLESRRQFGSSVKSSGSCALPRKLACWPGVIEPSLITCG